MMLYVAGIVGVVMLLMMGGLKVLGGQVKAERAQRVAAEGANKTLAADCKGKIDGLNRAISDIAKADQARAARGKAAKAKADAEKAKTDPKVQQLTRQAAAPPVATTEAQCQAATLTLQDVAKARHP